MKSQLIADIYAGIPSSSPADSFSLGDLVIFTAWIPNRRFIYRSDGSTAGTYTMREEGSGFSPDTGDGLNGVVFKGKLYFAASGGAQGRELWVSDGNTTSRFANLRLDDPAGSGPTEFVVAGDYFFFTADDGLKGRELWVSDGTMVGTRMVADIVPGLSGSVPKGLVADATGSKVFFSATTSDSGSEPWVSDGTAAGTVLLAEVAAGSQGSGPSGWIAVGNQMFFTAENGINGRELWVADVGQLGARLVKDIVTGSAGSGPVPIAALGSTKLLFTADDGVNGRELWVSDGTE